MNISETTDEVALKREHDAASRLLLKMKDRFYCMLNNERVC